MFSLPLVSRDNLSMQSAQLDIIVEELACHRSDCNQHHQCPMQSRIPLMSVQVKDALGSPIAGSVKSLSNHITTARPMAGLGLHF